MSGLGVNAVSSLRAITSLPPLTCDLAVHIGRRYCATDDFKRSPAGRDLGTRFPGNFKFTRNMIYVSLITVY